MPKDFAVRPISGRPALSDEVANSIRTLILDGVLPGGTPLRIDELARELGTSPTPVREALITLRAERFVESEPRKGFRVLPLSLDDINDIFAVGTYIEGELAARAADRITPDELERLARILERSAQASTREVPALHTEFHTAIAEAARAPKLEAILTYVTLYAPKAFMGEKNWRIASHRDHAALLDALRAHDAEEAKRIAVEHDNLARTAILKVFSEREELASGQTHGTAPVA
jgi:DNA-binding GntR family transcriptional regulator